MGSLVLSTLPSSVTWAGGTTPTCAYNLMNMSMHWIRKGSDPRLSSASSPRNRSLPLALLPHHGRAETCMSVISTNYRSLSWWFDLPLKQWHLAQGRCRTIGRHMVTTAGPFQSMVVDGLSTKPPGPNPHPWNHLRH